jgi:tetratricopeptide (TPR) repeat protein
MGLGREFVWLKRAERAPLFSADQAALLEKAYAIQPHNGATAYAIGEAYRIQSAEGDLKTTLALTEKAMRWFARGMTNNPFDGYNYMRHGMCLDWLERHAEAEAFFLKADELDPNGYFTTAHVGWHYVQAKDFASARPWLERSLKLQRKNNQVAETHLELVNQRLLESAMEGGHRSLIEILRAQPTPQ